MPRLRLNRSKSSIVLGRRNKEAKSLSLPFLPPELSWSVPGICGQPEREESPAPGTNGHNQDHSSTSVFDFPSASQSQQHQEGSLRSADECDHDADEDWWKGLKLSQRRSSVEQEAINDEVRENIAKMLKQMKRIRQAEKDRKLQRSQMPPPPATVDITLPPRCHSRPKSNKQSTRTIIEEHPYYCHGDVSPSPFPCSQYQVEKFAASLPKPLTRQRKPNAGNGKQRSKPEPKRKEPAARATAKKSNNDPAKTTSGPTSMSTKRHHAKRGTASKQARETIPHEDFSEDSVNVYQDSQALANVCSSQGGRSQPTAPGNRIVPVFGKKANTPQAFTADTDTTTPRRTPTLGVARKRTPTVKIVSTATPSKPECVQEKAMSSVPPAATGPEVFLLPNLFSPSPRLTVGNECELPFTQNDASQAKTELSKMDILCRAVDESDIESVCSQTNNEDSAPPSSSQAWIMDGESLSQSSQLSAKFKVPYRQRNITTPRYEE